MQGQRPEIRSRLRLARAVKRRISVYSPRAAQSPQGGVCYGMVSRRVYPAAITRCRGNARNQEQAAACPRRQATDFCVFAARGAKPARRGLLWHGEPSGLPGGYYTLQGQRQKSGAGCGLPAQQRVDKYPQSSKAVCADYRPDTAHIRTRSFCENSCNTPLVWQNKS